MTTRHDSLKGAPDEIIEAYDNLNAQQRQFTVNYLADPNGAKAAVDAGYSKHTARNQASKLLKNQKIKAIIEWANAQAAEALGITPERVLETLAETTFHNIQDFFLTDEHGNVIMRDISALPREVAGAIKKIKITNRRLGSAEDPIDEQKIEFELYDKQKGSELLGKHFKLFTDVVEHTSDVPDTSELEEALQLLKELGLDSKVLTDATSKVH